MYFLPPHHGDSFQEKETGGRNRREGQVFSECRAFQTRFHFSFRQAIQARCQRFRYVYVVYAILFPLLHRSDLHDDLGPTSPAHLLHSQATINSRIYENYDQRYQHTFEVSKSGDGLIQVQKPANDDHRQARSKPLDLHVERDVMESLINAYFADIAPMLPVITEAEFLATPNPPAILMYSMCLVAAARREMPQKVFDSIRHMVNTIIKEEDVLSTASFTNLQAILILCMTTDCHSQFVPTALSGLWIRLGAAIRMVGFLFLPFLYLPNLVCRPRIWGCIVLNL